MAEFISLRKISARIAACLSAVSVFFGCSDMKYAIYIDPSLQTSKISVSTIAVFPVDQLSYSPPTGCMNFSVSTGDQEKYQKAWNEKVRSSLIAKFPNQKWVFLYTDSPLLKTGGVDFPAIIEISKASSYAEQINVLNKDRVMYEPLTTRSDMQRYLQKVSDSTGAKYAVIFVSPSLSGETRTSYNPGYMTPNGMMGGGFSSQTYYTADVQILVWECSSGRLLFSSGGWCNSSSPCFFIPPEDMAIDGANGKFQKNLQRIITYLIKYDATKYFAQAPL